LWSLIVSLMSLFRYSPGYDFNGAARRKNVTRDSTTTLKAWLNEHRKNPYPTKGEKIMLAIITKMTLTQVRIFSTFFQSKFIHVLVLTFFIKRNLRLVFLLVSIKLKHKFSTRTESIHKSNIIAFYLKTIFQIQTLIQFYDRHKVVVKSINAYGFICLGLVCD
jgi:hypothetical protein